jgi:NAD(P)-dependent dehydrogenase (short-subunit alcohol dehydrogenase family)
MASHAQGKTVLVTGAAGGLGKAIATAFLEAGANVVICDVNAERIASATAEWTQQGHAGKFMTTQADVTDEAAVQKLIDEAAAAFADGGSGRLDVLVNNAGIMDDFSPVGECSKDMWDRVLAINLNGPYFTSKAAIAQFETQTPAGGVIINIGSNAGVSGFKAGAAYTVSKHGVIGLTKNTAGYYGPRGTYCMALILGGMMTNISDAFKTGMHMDMFQRVGASQTKIEPPAGFTPIESVAKYCVFLTDPDIAPNANGSCVTFNRNWPES